MQTLNEFLRDKECKGFRPIPHYSKDGDMITYFSKDVRCYVKQVDDLLSIYYSDVTDEIVGIKIKGIDHYFCL